LKVVPLLLELVQPKVATADDPGDDDDEHAGTRGLRDIAISALGSLQYGAGVPALIDLSKHGAPGIRHTSVFWLGQTGDARALAALHEVIENEREESRVRAHAIFSLAHGDGTPEVELAWLRSLYPRLHDDKLKDAILMGEAQDERDGGRWLLGRVRDGQEPMHLRKQALFWAGQRKATPTADLVAAFRDITDEDLREHAIFVLSQRNDEAATSALIGIARSDRDRRMRSRALFWLAQKHDARVTKLISDLVTQ